MKKTKFYKIHEKLGAKIVEFAGYLMPVQYSSIISEHKAVRNSAGVFDISHMGEIFVRGEKAPEFVQYITINNVSKLYPGKVQYSAMCYPDGGIVDDLLVYKLSADEFMLVVNASNIEKDFNWMRENNKWNIQLDNLSDDYSLLAVQGPNSQKLIQKICNRDLNLGYYHFFNTEISGVDVLVSRTGYTGEIGYELYFKGDEITAGLIWNNLFESVNEYDLKPVGLGARDILRLEMGYYLYGNDIDQTTNPLEAGLGWITKLDKDNFIGKKVLVKIKSEGIKRKLVPMLSEEKAFPRHGYDIISEEKKIGTITSGTISPILNKPIALGYVDKNYAAEGNLVNFLIRGKKLLQR